MDKDLELARVNLQIQAEHVVRLLGVSMRTAAHGPHASAVADKLELLEALLWKHHRRLVQLQIQAKHVAKSA